MNAREVRRLWAAYLIRRGRELSELPRYGSVEWCELPDSDPRKVAAVVVAAECWVYDDDHRAECLHAEISAARLAGEQREAEQFAQIAAGVRHMADVPTIAALREVDNYVTIECAGQRSQGGSPYPCPSRVLVEWAPGWMSWRVLCESCRRAEEAAS